MECMETHWREESWSAWAKWLSWKWEEHTASKSRDYSGSPSLARLGALYVCGKRQCSDGTLTTDISVAKRGARLMSKLDWAIQSRLEHLSESVLSSEQYLSSILEVLNGLAGEHEDDEMPSSGRRSASMEAREE